MRLRNFNGLDTAIKEYLSVAKHMKSLPTLSNYHSIYLAALKKKLKDSNIAATDIIKNLIPGTTCGLQMHCLLEEACNTEKVRLQVIETLVIRPSTTVFYFTQKGIVRKITGSKAVEQFFRCCRSVKLPSPYMYPKYIVKSADCVELFYSEPEARSRLAQLSECVIQKYIFPAGPVVSKIRVHYKKDKPFDIYSISNRLRVPKSSCQGKKSRPNPGSSIRELMERLNNLALNADQDSVSPFCIDEQTNEDNSVLLSEPANNSREEINYSEAPDTNSPFLLLGSSSANWNCRKYCSTDQALHTVLCTIVSLIEKRVFSHKSTVNELVVDFLKDLTKNLYFLNVNSYSKTVKSMTEFRQNNRTNVAITPLSKKCAGKQLSQHLTDLINDSEFNSPTLKQEVAIRRSSKYISSLQVKVSSYELKNTIKRQSQSAITPSRMSFRQSCEDSILSYKLGHNIDSKGRFHPMYISTDPKINPATRVLAAYSPCPLPQNNAFFTQKKRIFSESIKRYNSIMMRVKKIHLKGLEISGKYGGSAFVHTFVGELHRQVKCKRICPFYSNEAEKPQQIISFYEKLFSLSTDMSFRKKFNEIHMNKGITNEDCREYILTVSSLTNAFNFDQIHQDLLLDEISYTISKLT